MNLVLENKRLVKELRMWMGYGAARRLLKNILKTEF